MYEYLKALKDRFVPTTQNKQLLQEIESHRQALICRLDRSGRKELLRLIDAQSALQNETALDSFVAGFRLAKGIESELQSEEPYSYTRELERRACEEFEKGVEDRCPNVGPTGKETSVSAKTVAGRVVTRQVMIRRQANGSSKMSSARPRQR